MGDKKPKKVPYIIKIHESCYMVRKKIHVSKVLALCFDPMGKELRSGSLNHNEQHEVHKRVSNNEIKWTALQISLWKTLSNMNSFWRRHFIIRWTTRCSQGFIELSLSIFHMLSEDSDDEHIMQQNINEDRKTKNFGFNWYKPIQTFWNQRFKTGYHLL